MGVSTREVDVWTPHDVFVLMTLVGNSTYANIAAVLGRTEATVQRKASNLGLSAHKERRESRESHLERVDALQNTYLAQDEAELAEFLPKEEDIDV